MIWANLAVRKPFAFACELSSVKSPISPPATPEQTNRPPPLLQDQENSKTPKVLLYGSPNRMYESFVVLRRLSSLSPLTNFSLFLRFVLSSTHCHYTAPAFLSVCEGRRGHPRSSRSFRSFKCFENKRTRMLAID